MPQHKIATGPAVWYGYEQARRKDWALQLDDDQVKELENATDLLRSRGLTLDQVTRSDFDLPSLTPTLDAVAEELEKGRGFALIRGLTVGDYTADELGAMFWGIGTYLGIGVSQSAEGDRLGHGVRLISITPTGEIVEFRGYQVELGGNG